MTLIQIDARSETVHVPEERTARITVDRAIVQPGRVWNGVRINDLSSLYPYGELRIRLMNAAKKWIRDEGLRRRDLLTAEADMLVFGPYVVRSYTSLSPKDFLKQVQTERRGVIGYDETEDPDPSAADFVFKARFISRRHRPVQAKVGA
jgi:hypothetical protein